MHVVDKFKAHERARDYIEDAIDCVQDGQWWHAVQALLMACDASPGDCRETARRMARVRDVLAADSTNEDSRLAVLGLLECWTLGDSRCFRLLDDGRVEVFISSQPNPLAELFK